MPVTVQCDKTTGRVVAVVDHGGEEIPAAPGGRELIVVKGGFENAEKTCGAFIDKASGDYFADQAKTTKLGKVTL